MFSKQGSQISCYNAAVLNAGGVALSVQLFEGLQCTLPRILLLKISAFVRDQRLGQRKKLSSQNSLLDLFLLEINPWKYKTQKENLHLELLD
jgi:hypothetical protein